MIMKRKVMPWTSFSPYFATCKDTKLSLSITGRVMLAQDRKKELLQGTVECVHSGEEEENVIICG